MSNRLKVLILGGYGTFGGRLAHLLMDEALLTLLIGGRSPDKARNFCAMLGGSVEAMPVTFDRESGVEAQLRALAPDIIVDASGPFQNYADDYAVIRAAIACGVHYLDLADGAEFVDGVAKFDAAAREKGVFILSGVSSFPVLTAAVVRALSHDMVRVERVAGGIAPSPYAGVGLNVIRAVASYGGRPVKARLQGTQALLGYGLISSRWFTIAPPGRLPLPPIRFSLVDVPDLNALPQLWPDLRDVWMGAGPVPSILHRALSALALGVRFKLLPSLSPFAKLMYAAINRLRWGDHRGGMFVAVSGRSEDGRSIERSWHLLAEGDDGPLIPSMAIEAIIRRCVRGKYPVAGARAAIRELELSDYEQLFQRRTIFTGVRQAEPALSGAPLYRIILGAAWDVLPKAIRDMHDLTGAKSATGRAIVERGRGAMARAIGALFRFPGEGRDVPLRVTFRRENGREIWQRDFAGRKFSSTQECGRGGFEGLLCERFGPFAFGLALVVDGARLDLVVRRWTLFGLPLPLTLAPHGVAYEIAEGGKFSFHVEIAHRFAGLIVRYRGWLDVDQDSERIAAPTM